MEGSVLSFLKAEWKVSDTGSAHWAFCLILFLGDTFGNSIQIFDVIYQETMDSP